MVRVILASGSPRRKELLEQVGVSFEISVADGEEIISKKLPWEIVEELSLQKATEVAGRYEAKQEITEQTVVIGADTIVAYGEEIMGKPKNEEMAKEMLQKLQDGSHQVYTGVTLIIMTAGNRQVVTFHEKTDVEMYPMSEKQIDAYVATKEPMDKAGSYAIQGKCAAYIKGICGDYNNVVGLPVARLMQEIFKLGIVL
ncbi:MAG: septum formation protein Maf [Lachnospiraceae bacterium]|nr:septum formation protein Maf [Lachnospiraceae bacterium]